LKEDRGLFGWLTGYLMSILLVGIVTLLGEVMKTAVHPTNLAMLYFISLIIVALRWGRGPAVFTAAAGILCFDYFLVPPYYAFAVADIDYLFTFAIFLGVGLSISSLVFKTRQQAAEAKEKEMHASYLMQTEKLQSALLHSISHDLRTPLVSITGALSGVLNDPLLQGEETRKELLTSAYSESRRLNTLVENLLDMTRIDAGLSKAQAMRARFLSSRTVLGAA
jgi:two-component system sensor histidine kinase KdpD